MLIARSVVKQLKTRTCFAIFIFIVGCSRPFVLVNNSDDQLIPSEHFDRCILKANFKKLIPDPKYKNDSVLFSYHPEVRDSSSCDGIYYYRYVSRSFRSATYRDSDGQRYSLYFLFVMVDGDLYPLAEMTKQQRSRFIEDKEALMAKRFGDVVMKDLKQSLLDGSRRFY
jgi:hypothetical protein